MLLVGLWWDWWVAVLLELGLGPEQESGPEFVSGPGLGLEPGWEAEVEHGVELPSRAQRGRLWGIVGQADRAGLFRAGLLGPEAGPE